MQWVALKVSLLELVGPPGIKWVPRGVVSGHCAKSLSPAKQIFPRSQLSGLEKPSYGENVLPPHLPQNYATATTKCFSNTSLWYWLWKINGIHLFPRPAQAIFLLPVLWFQMWTFQNFDHLRMRISATWLWSMDPFVGDRSKGFHIPFCPSLQSACASPCGRCWSLKTIV